MAIKDSDSQFGRRKGRPNDMRSMTLVSERLHHIQVPPCGRHLHPLVPCCTGCQRVKQHKKKTGTDVSANMRAMDKLKREVEKAKCTLSNQQ